MVFGAPSSTDSPTLGPSIPSPGKLSSSRADAGEQPFEGVPLNLTGGIVDDLPVQSGEPVGARALDVLVVGNAEHVRTAQRVAWPGVPIGGRPLSGVPCSGVQPATESSAAATPGAETACGTDGYQRSDRCERVSAFPLPTTSTPHRPQASSRTNCSCWYCSAQAARRTLPLVVVGIDPGGTTTRSPTFRPCAFEIADVTSLLITLSRCNVSSAESLALLLELDHGHEVLRAVHGDRYRRDPTAGDLLHRRLDVLGIVVTPADDQQVLDAPDDEQLTFGDESQVAGPQPGPLRRAGRRVDQRRAEAQLFLRRFTPVPGGDVLAVHPHLADQTLFALAAGFAVDDPQRGRMRYRVGDQRVCRCLPRIA